MVFADTFEIYYKLKFDTLLKTGYEVSHFLGKNFFGFLKIKKNFFNI